MLSVKMRYNAYMRQVTKLLTAVSLVLAVGLSVTFLWRAYKAHEQVEFAAAEARQEIERRTASSKNRAVSLVSLEEVFANVNSGKGDERRMHTLGIKLDLELFEEESRLLLDSRLGGVKNAIITTALEQDYDWLNTIAGKLFFKESLVARINEFFNRAIVRDIHFSSFYLQ